MFLTQIVNGKVTEMALCEECAKARGLFDPQSLTFAEKFFPQELQRQMDKIVRQLVQGDKEEKHRPAAEGCDVLTACPVCHFTLEDYRRTNRLGCPDCYTFLASELNAPCEDAEDGETPQQEQPRRSTKDLEAELQQAVEREDYERAAVLRDEIKALNNASKA
ncbi:MAG: UvrB/UvrC motif-containing protein [Akkermansia sp.]|nr:UvrB/UvrC motif-containing protein [Akkermansia sp.]